MTRPYAIKKLLEHGPMPRSEIVEVMGGNRNTTQSALYYMIRTRKIIRVQLPEVGTAYKLAHHVMS